MTISRLTRHFAVTVTSLLMAVALGCEDNDDFDPDAGDVHSVPGLTSPELDDFFVGKALFEKKFTYDQGLGPFFVETSCAGCHTSAGRGPGFVTIFGRNVNGEFLNMINEGGPTLQSRSSVTGVSGERIPAGANVREIRVAPPVFGRGLIEAIPDETIRNYEDRLDADGDGISGRLNEVDNADIGLPSHPQASVFGLKGQISFIERFVANAFRHDMGLTSSFFVASGDAFSTELVNPDHPGVKDGKKGVDIDDETVQLIANFIRFTDFPPRGPVNPDVERGDSLFSVIGCHKCHVPVMMTGPHPVAALSNREVELYSDLLLHDMGPDMTDHTSPGFNGVAIGSEWRTPTLRGLGTLFPYMHDGRARSLEEAILMHGGEGSSARDAFNGLGEADKQNLIDFLKSL